jgi:hypothetical protein
MEDKVRTWRSSLLAWALAGLLAPAVAQTPPDPEQQRRLAEQKLKLVEMLVNAPAAKAATQEPETAELVERGRKLLQEAKAALAAQQYGPAAQALDEALRNVSKANSRLAGSGGLSDSVQKQRLQEMSEQVATYRSSLAAEISRDKQGAGVREALQRVDFLAEEARKLAAAGRYGDANKKMAEAYRQAVEDLSRLRAGQEVVMSLKFETPAEEYAYEQKRFQSNEILVNMMVADGKAEAGDKRRMIEGFQREAGRLKDEAVALAAGGSHKEAVAAMEKAVVQLNRALQLMGVPVF